MKSKYNTYVFSDQSIMSKFVNKKNDFFCKKMEIKRIIIYKYYMSIFY